jgi:hypothetical protein
MAKIPSTEADLTLLDWASGDPEGDRAFLFRAYRHFLGEVKRVANPVVLAVFEKWKVCELNVDDFPRIQIEYPEDFQGEK